MSGAGEAVLEPRELAADRRPRHPLTLLPSCADHVGFLVRQRRAATAVQINNDEPQYGEHRSEPTSLESFRTGIVEGGAQLLSIARPDLGS